MSVLSLGEGTWLSLSFCSTVFIKGLLHAKHSARCQEHQSKPLHCGVFIGPMEHASEGQSKKKYTKQLI